MVESLRALLEGLIDYAGIFPPAKLPVEDAVRNFARYRGEPDAWMMARFVFPARRLAELDRYAASLFTEGRPFAVSALGVGGDNADAAVDALAADLEVIHSFRARHGSRVIVDAIENRLPATLASGEDSVGLRTYLVAADDAIQGAGADTVAVFHETPLGPAWAEQIVAVAEALAADGRAAGFKLRTGGLDAAAFPSPAQVAAVICACRRFGVPFKATAGLHHPMRHFSASVDAHMHGFLNVFGGTALAAVHDLDVTALAAILEEEDSNAFRFEDDALHWKHLGAPVAAVVEARRTLAISYGSCSFDEPREDMTALGLIS